MSSLLGSCLNCSNRLSSHERLTEKPSHGRKLCAAHILRDALARFCLVIFMPPAEDSRAHSFLRLRNFLADAEPGHREEQQALGLRHVGVARQHLSGQRGPIGDQAIHA